MKKEYKVQIAMRKHYHSEVKSFKSTIKVLERCKKDFDDAIYTDNLDNYIGEVNEDLKHAESRFDKYDKIIKDLKDSGDITISEYNITQVRIRG